jgi:hypothetical protein
VQVDHLLELVFVLLLFAAVLDPIQVEQFVSIVVADYLLYPIVLLMSH